MERSSDGMEPEQIPCHSCKRGFASVAALDKHQSSRLSCGPEKTASVCPTCDKPFALPSDLRRHVLRPLACARRLREQGMEDLVRAPLASDEHQCLKCSKVFARRDSLVRHLLKAGNCDEELRCDGCGESFRVARSLRMHMKASDDFLPKSERHGNRQFLPASEEVATSLPKQEFTERLGELDSSQEDSASTDSKNSTELGTAKAEASNKGTSSKGPHSAPAEPKEDCFSRASLASPPKASLAPLECGDEDSNSSLLDVSLDDFFAADVDQSPKRDEEDDSKSSPAEAQIKEEQDGPIGDEGGSCGAEEAGPASEQKVPFQPPVYPQCPVCQLSFSDRVWLAKHLDTHPRCSKQSEASSSSKAKAKAKPRLVNLPKDKPVVHGPDGHICSKCGASFAKVSADFCTCHVK